MLDSGDQRLVFQIEKLNMLSNLTLEERKPGKQFAGNKQFRLAVETPGVDEKQEDAADWR